MPTKKPNKAQEFWVFLAFLFVSFCLWLMKVTNESFETNITVGVIVKHVPAGVELENDDVEIEVGVRAKGSKLLAYKLWKECSIVVDYADFADNDGILSMPTSKLTNNIGSSLPAFFTFRYFEDDSLTVKIKKESVTLPVIFNPVIVAGNNVEYDGYRLSADSVIVTAPPAFLNGVENVHFGTDSVILVTRDTLLRCTLPQRRYVKYEPAVLTANIKASPYTMLNIRRRVQLVDTVSGEITPSDIPDSVTVSCMLPPSMAAKVGKAHFNVYAAPGDIVKGERDTLRLRVSSLPPFVRRENVRVEPEYILLDKKWSFGIFGIFK